MTQGADDDDPITREDLIEALRDLDICYMATRAEDGHPQLRPMSNNGQVEWDGTNWFFSNGDTDKIRQIKADPHVTLTFEGEGIWIALYGTATLHVEDRELFEQYWTKDIDRWFPQGIDTPGLHLIEVKADMAEGWGRVGDGKLKL